MRELSIVVTCTGRKALAAGPGLRARDLPQDSLAHRADTWRLRVDSARTPRLPLRELYAGEAWQRSLAVEARATAAGFTPTLYVASAGLGLRPASTEAPGYAATFTSGHADTVADGDVESGQWWSELISGIGALPLADLPVRPTLVVLSAAYAKPLKDDVAALAARNPDVVVVGGGAPVDGAMHVAANRALRTELGGSVMSLNQRIAAAWLDRLDGRPLASTVAAAEWRRWVNEVQRVEKWDRRHASDDTVVEAIRSLLAHNDRLAWSPALRLLREGGVACEQTRFKQLFALASEAR